MDNFLRNILGWASFPIKSQVPPTEAVVPLEPEAQVEPKSETSPSPSIGE